MPLPFFQQSFIQQSVLFLLVLLIASVCAIAGVHIDLLGPIWQGLGIALPTLLGTHGLVAGVKAFRAEGQTVEEREVAAKAVPPK